MLKLSRLKKRANVARGATLLCHARTLFAHGALRPLRGCFDRGWHLLKSSRPLKISNPLVSGEGFPQACAKPELQFAYRTF